MPPSKRDQTEGQIATRNANAGKSRGSNGKDSSLRIRQIIESSNMEMQNAANAAAGEIKANIASALTSPIPKPERPDTRRQTSSNPTSTQRKAMLQQTRAKKAGAGKSDHERPTATSVMKAARILGNLRERASIAAAAIMDAANTPTSARTAIQCTPSMAPPLAIGMQNVNVSLPK